MFWCYLLIYAISLNIQGQNFLGVVCLLLVIILSYKIFFVTLR